MRYLLVLLFISSASLFSMQKEGENNKENIQTNATPKISYDPYYEYPGSAPVTPPPLRKPTREVQKNVKTTCIFGCCIKDNL